MHYVGVKEVVKNTQMGFRVTCSTIEPRGNITGEMWFGVGYSNIHYLFK
jgi:hypothetical protein